MKSSGFGGEFRIARHKESSLPLDFQPDTSGLVFYTVLGTRKLVLSKNIYWMALCPVQVSLRNL